MSTPESEPGTSRFSRGAFGQALHHISTLTGGEPGRGEWGEPAPAEPEAPSEPFDAESIAADMAARGGFKSTAGDEQPLPLPYGRAPDRTLTGASPQSLDENARYRYQQRQAAITGGRAQGQAIASGLRPPAAPGLNRDLLGTTHTAARPPAQAAPVSAGMNAGSRTPLGMSRGDAEAMTG